MQSVRLMCLRGVEVITLVRDVGSNPTEGKTQFFAYIRVLHKIMMWLSHIFSF